MEMGSEMGSGEMGLPWWLGRGLGHQPPSAAPVPTAPQISQSWALPPTAMLCQKHFLVSESSVRPRQSKVFLQTLQQCARAVRDEDPSVGCAHHGVKQTQLGVWCRLGGAGAGSVLLPSHAGLCRGSHRRQAACSWVFLKSGCVSSQERGWKVLRLGSPAFLQPLSSRSSPGTGHCEEGPEQQAWGL